MSLRDSINHEKSPYFQHRIPFFFLLLDGGGKGGGDTSLKLNEILLIPLTPALSRKGRGGFDSIFYQILFGAKRAAKIPRVKRRPNKSFEILKYHFQARRMLAVITLCKSATPSTCSPMIMSR